jgi:hypothetical protein
MNMSDSWLLVGGIFIALLFAPVFFSYLMEALRSEPSTPTQLKWNPQVPIRYVEVNGQGRFSLKR